MYTCFLVFHTSVFSTNLILFGKATLLIEKYFPNLFHSVVITLNALATYRIMEFSLLP